MEMLTKYECSRIIGVRTLQLQMNAPILIDMQSVDIRNRNNEMYIAALELKQGALDLMIRRPLPQNQFHEVHISKLTLPDDLDALISLYE